MTGCKLLVAVSLSQNEVAEKANFINLRAGELILRLRSYLFQGDNRLGSIARDHSSGIHSTTDLCNFSLRAS